MKMPKIPWARLIAEAALILVSVYIAIVLEGKSQDREAVEAARTALAQMLEEMQADRSDLSEIREEQSTRARLYADLNRWLKRPRTMPADSVAEAMDAFFQSNRTLYPRRSAWTTMVAAGQLGRLEAPALVTRLGNFYESVNARIIDNGDDYDASLNEIAVNLAPEVWDSFSGRLLVTDAREVTVFRNQLRYMHLGWTVWYVDLLDDYEVRLDSLIDEIESYLAESGP